MGLFDSIRAIGRAIDPTSSTAPLGGYVKQGITAVTGSAGTAVLGAASQVGAAARNPGPTVPTTTGGPLPPSPGSPFGSASVWGGSALVLALVALAAFFLLRKR